MALGLNSIRLFLTALSPKWDSVANDGELIDDDSRHGRNVAKSKAFMKKAMAKVFAACHKVLQTMMDVL